MASKVDYTNDDVENKDILKLRGEELVDEITSSMRKRYDVVLRATTSGNSGRKLHIKDPDSDELKPTCCYSDRKNHDPNWAEKSTKMFPGTHANWCKYCTSLVLFNKNYDRLPKRLPDLVG